MVMKVLVKNLAFERRSKAAIYTQELQIQTLQTHIPTPVFKIMIPNHNYKSIVNNSC